MEFSVQYELTTPGFVGGSRPSDTAELRLPTFKGQIRWWWRALAWSSYGGILDDIHRAEAAVFGSAEKGRGAVVLRKKQRKENVQDSGALRYSNPNRTVVGPGARYLGYGVVKGFGDQGGHIERPCVKAGSYLEIEGTLRGTLDPRAKGLLKDALIALGLFGGVGSRARRGYGSVIVSSLVWGGEGIQPPANVDELTERIAELARVNGPGGLPPYTAFSPHTRVVVVTGRNDPLEMLDVIGAEMIRYRSCGRNGQTSLGEESEGRFEDDHDLMKGVVNGGEAETHPRRAVFGLPHNYYFSSIRRRASVVPSGPSRRASPLLIHIHTFPNNTSAAVLTFMPAEFLPGDISVDGTHVSVSSSLWQPIEDFLNRFLSPVDPKNKVKARGITATEVVA